LPTDVHLPARMYHGQWVVNCPRCPNVEKRGLCDDGTVGGVDDRTFVCRESHGGCGFRADVLWPATIAEIEALVAARPRPFRNWSPGETLQDLLRENIENGVAPTAALEGPQSTRPLVQIVGDSIAAGDLEFVPLNALPRGGS
jgi:hypothetical protein